MINFTYTLEELPQVIPEIWAIIEHRKVILLNGEMGAGKTTLVAALARYRGILGDIQSPTYSLINEYEYEYNNTSMKWIHSDWFRISHEEEAIDVGFEELLNAPNTQHFIEWAEKIEHLIPSNAIQLNIIKDNENTRTLTIE